MNRIKKVFTAIHLLGWLLLFVFLCWVLRSEGVPGWWYLSVKVLVVLGAVFYSHFYILTRYLNRRRFGFYIAGLVLILLVGPLLFIWAQGREILDWPSFLDQYFTSLFSFVVIGLLLSWVARASENWFINTLKREALEKQAIQAELSYLKSQINPHFLFNTLNNIHTLSYKGSPLAPDAIMRLSSLMRYMLYEANASTVALQREINYLQDFISLQQLRYKAAAIVDFRIAGDIDSCRVAPLLFIHLLENAYKHSHRQLAAGDIKVSLEVVEDNLTFSIENPIGTNKTGAIQEVGGIGLANVQKRLQLLYPDRHSFNVLSTEGSFRVVLKINRLNTQVYEVQANVLYS
ncbi:sensor histidine kinase [Telluribacter humicola]|uniref:sensor histidine kinase n=1 Tax=Telluribacter humicola TaxID=1720261 RepID=UPI001A975E53|nr:sensor histidine kinase [Telluribacter humicola]